jgi:hypothetical protein
MNLTLGRVNVVDLGVLRLPKNTKFNINVPQVDKAVKSVLFLSNAGYNQKETALPWAYCGNDGAIFKECIDLKLGATVNVTVISYPDKNQAGTPFPTVWAAIRFTEGTAAPAIAQPTPAPAPAAPTAQACSTPKVCT